MWRNAEPRHTSHAPMKKTGCGMVSFGQDKLVLFAGYGIPSPRVHPGSVFIPNKGVTDGVFVCVLCVYMCMSVVLPVAKHTQCTNVSLTQSFIAHTQNQTQEMHSCQKLQRTCFCVHECVHALFLVKIN